MTHDLDPNHIIDEDYPLNQHERMDRLCAQRLNAPDFGRPCLTRKRRAIGFLLVVIGLMLLYSIAEKYLG